MTTGQKSWEHSKVIGQFLQMFLVEGFFFNHSLEDKIVSYQ